VVLVGLVGWEVPQVRRPCSVPIGNFFGLGKVEDRSSGIEPDQLRDGEVRKEVRGRVVPIGDFLGLGKVQGLHTGRGWCGGDEYQEARGWVGL
jgi:hypothetical protein